METVPRRRVQNGQPGGGDRRMDKRQREDYELTLPEGDTPVRVRKYARGKKSARIPTG